MIRKIYNWLMKNNNEKSNPYGRLLQQQDKILEKVNDIPTIKNGILEIQQQLPASEQYSLEENKVDTIIFDLGKCEANMFQKRKRWLFLGLVCPLVINLILSIWPKKDMLNFYYTYDWHMVIFNNIYLTFSLKVVFGILLAFFLTLSMHSRMASKIIKRTNDPDYISNRNINKKSNWKFTIKLVTSPDYYFAELNKNKLDNFTLDKKHCSCSSIYPLNNLCSCQMEVRKAFRRTYILLCNTQNLIISIIFVLISILLGYHFTFEWLIYLIIPHLLWRSIEIFFSFYHDATNLKIKMVTKRDYSLPDWQMIQTPGHQIMNQTNQDHVDVINEWKTSSLRKTHRIMLALFSLIEIILLYSIIYYGLHHMGLTGYEGSSIYFYEMVLHCISLSVFNISFTPSYSWWEKILHVSQLVVSINLIVLSLASYLSLTDILSTKDKERIMKKAIQNGQQKEGAIEQKSDV